MSSHKIDLLLQAAMAAFVSDDADFFDHSMGGLSAVEVLRRREQRREQFNALAKQMVTKAYEEEREACAKKATTP